MTPVVGQSPTTGASEPGEALTLSAQHLRAATVTIDEQMIALILTDGEEAVEISHEIGDPERAALHLLQVADELRAHAERIRRQARAGRRGLSEVRNGCRENPARRAGFRRILRNQ